MDGGHRENVRHKAEHLKTAQGQWLVQPQPSMKQIMAIMAERDAAIHTRNVALSEKKAAFAERDVAFLQRDSAIAERNNAIIERDNAIAAFQNHEESAPTDGNDMTSGPPVCRLSRHVHQLQQHTRVPHISESPYITEAMPITPTVTEAVKSQRGKRTNDAKATPVNRKTSKSPRRVKKESEDFNKQTVSPNSNWKGNDLGLNQVVFDESTMLAPVCSCTGVFRQCYKWGNGGWQSSCCTTMISMYPLPQMPNKRHARIGGRKMSGGAFNKLLSRLAADGYDLSHPVDLKGHWARHGTNRYITIK